MAEREAAGPSERNYANSPWRSLIRSLLASEKGPEDRASTVGAGNPSLETLIHIRSPPISTVQPCQSTVPKPAIETGAGASSIWKKSCPVFSIAPPQTHIAKINGIKGPPPFSSYVIIRSKNAAADALTPHVSGTLGPSGSMPFPTNRRRAKADLPNRRLLSCDAVALKGV